jgi:hypothetical protein
MAAKRHRVGKGKKHLGGGAYAACVKAGCTIDHHESDLYILATPQAIGLTAGEPNRSFFTSQVDGKRWIDIPFGYTPYWESRSAR